MIMTRFVEYRDKQGCRQLVNLGLVDYVIDLNKTIRVVIGEESFILPIAYTTFKEWLRNDTNPILSTGDAL